MKQTGAADWLPGNLHSPTVGVAACCHAAFPIKSTNARKYSIITAPFTTSLNGVYGFHLWVMYIHQTFKVKILLWQLSIHRHYRSNLCPLGKYMLLVMVPTNFTSKDLVYFCKIITWAFMWFKYEKKEQMANLLLSS